MQALQVKSSKIAWFAWLVPQLIGWAAIIQLIIWEVYYSFLACILLIISYYSFKKWKKQYRTNPMIVLKQSVFPKTAFWEISFKKGPTQKIELIQYYRSLFFIIFIYKPIYSKSCPYRPPRCSYILFYDALSPQDYRALARALWPG